MPYRIGGAPSANSPNTCLGTGPRSRRKVDTALAAGAVAADNGLLSVLAEAGKGSPRREIPLSGPFSRIGRRGVSGLFGTVEPIRSAGRFPRFNRRPHSKIRLFGKRRGCLVELFHRGKGNFTNPFMCVFHIGPVNTKFLTLILNIFAYETHFAMGNCSGVMYRERLLGRLRRHGAA